MKYFFTTLMLVGCAQLFGQVVVDFTNPNTSTWGDNAQMIRNLNGRPAVAMMWGGDANGDGKVIYVGDTDITPISAAVFLNPPNLGIFDPTTPVVNAYDPADTNMDGAIIYVGNTDITTISAAVFLHPFNLGIFDPTFIITQQIPE